VVASRGPLQDNKSGTRIIYAVHSERGEREESGFMGGALIKEGKGREGMSGEVWETCCVE